jgi:hypothetical protein
MLRTVTLQCDQEDTSIVKANTHNMPLTTPEILAVVETQFRKTWIELQAYGACILKFGGTLPILPVVTHANVVPINRGTAVRNRKTATGRKTGRTLATAA